MADRKRKGLQLFGLGLHWRWIVTGLIVAGIAVVLLILTLPVLDEPPPDYQPGYDLNTLGEASVSLDPMQDHLVSTADDSIAIYIPQGAYKELGSKLILLVRDEEFIPERSNDYLIRYWAVDLFIVLSNGDILTTTSFDPTILLCFNLDQQLIDIREADPEALLIQRYDESMTPATWVDLDVAPGWDEDQICSALDRLSLYALTVRISQQTTPTIHVVTPEPIDTVEAPDVYIFPLQSP